MTKGILFCLILFSLFIFILPITNSAFYIKDLFSVYNIGDILNFNVTIFEQVSGQYFFQILFFCDDKELTYFATPLIIEAGKQQEISIPSSIVTKEMLGKCVVNFVILDGSAKIISKSEKPVEITNNIIVETNFTKEVLPSSSFYIEGKAKLANGKIFNGTSNLEFYNSSYKTSVLEGNFSFSVVVPEKIKTGEHEIKISVEDGKGNIGMIKEKINILAVASKLLLELNNETFLPEEKIVVRPILFDQGGDILKRNITIKIFFEKKEIFSSVVETNETAEYVFEKIASPGKWNIVAEHNGLKTEKEIRILELRQIKINLVNDTLFVENTGNVLYAENLLIILEGLNKSTNVSVPVILDVGKNASYKLEAPDGVYDVIVGDKKWKNIPLTGKVAAALQIGKKSWLAENPIETAIFFLFIMLLVLLISQRKFRNEILAFVKRENLARKKAEFQQLKAEQEKKKIGDIFSKYVDKEIAEKLMKGIKTTKQEATFLFTDIRNYSEISESPEIVDILHNYFDIVSKAVHSYGGVVNRMFGDAVICIFNLKKQQQHELAAVRAALRIMQEMEKLNEKLKKKEIKIGIGIDSGNVVIGDLGSYIKSYQPIGKPVNVAYRLSCKGVNKILITKTVNEKISNFVKTKRLGIFELKGAGAIEVFVVE